MFIMTAITTGRTTETSTEPIRTSVAHEKRRVTDKYWIFLLIVAIALWVQAGPRVIQSKPSCRFYADDSVTANSTSDECKVEKKNRTDCENRTSKILIANDTVEYVLPNWGKNWLFDAITFNAGFLNANYERSGSIVIWAHIFFCACLIIYSSTLMRKFYRHQFVGAILMTYICTSFTCMVFLNNYISEEPSLSEVLESGLLCLIVPKIILFFIGCTCNEIRRRSQKNNKSRDKTVLRWSLFFILYPFPILYISFYGILIVATSCKFDTDDNFSYAVGILVVCYLLLTLYYFLLLVISCATSISYERRSPHFKDFFRAVYVVARYHLGTACFHATLICPRIWTTSVMNEKQFTRNPKVSAIRRFFFTHWKAHDLSLMITAACGHNHSESIRELLRLFSSDSPKLKNFQTYSRILKCCLAFLMAITSLTFISMWMHGIILDPRIATATWLAYLFGSYVASFALKFFDAVSDALWFNYDGVVRFEI